MRAAYIKAVVVSVLITIVTTAYGTVLFMRTTERKQGTKEPQEVGIYLGNGVYEYPAHLNLEENSRLKRTYINEEEDRAIYVDESWVAEKSDYSNLKINGLKNPRVVKETDRQLLLQVDNPECVNPGLSGTVVLNGENLPVAYIIALNKELQIICNKTDKNGG